LPDEKLNKKPNSAKKRPEKGRTVCLKARKKVKLVNYKNIIRNFLRNSDEALLGLVLELISDFTWFVRLHTLGTMVSQFAYSSIGSFLHESPSHHSRTYDQNNKTFSDVIVAFLSRDACLSASVQLT